MDNNAISLKETEECKMNNVVLIGRLDADPELRYLPGNGTPVCKFRLAVDRKFIQREETRSRV